MLVCGVKKVAAACFFCTDAAVLANSDYFALFAFDLAPSFAPRVRLIAQTWPSKSLLPTCAVPFVRQERMRQF